MVSQTKLITLLGGKCFLCGFDKYKSALQVAHVIPRSEGGADDQSNLVLLCANCHAAVDAGEWEMVDLKKKLGDPRDRKKIAQYMLQGLKNLKKSK